jgi:SEC-C motif domain protein
MPTDAGGPCPCDPARQYENCCGAYHAGRATAPTAEALMRSRFSAFARQNEAYLLRTWHPDTRPRTVGFDTNQRWTRLHILNTTDGSLLHTEGTVEFRADYKLRGRPGSLHENSRFVRNDGTWCYVGPLDDTE